jgi:FkbM family methyltransferase
MPRSHRLGDYAAIYPAYGQNLVSIAAALAKRRSLHVVDVGANVGDSALQILGAAAARVLCIEGDEYWLPFLERNAASMAEGIVLERSFVAFGQSAAGDGPSVRAIRRAGTTAFVPSQSEGLAGKARTPADILARHPEFRGADLIKSDTDGYDTELVPAFVEACEGGHPVVFFEYDPRLTELVGSLPADRVWDRLQALGYSRVLVWDNTGRPVGEMSPAEAKDRARSLGTPARRGGAYWDVALVHQDDSWALEALSGMAGGGQ